MAPLLRCCRERNNSGASFFPQAICEKKSSHLCLAPCRSPTPCQLLHPPRAAAVAGCICLIQCRCFGDHRPRRRKRMKKVCAFVVTLVLWTAMPGASAQHVFKCETEAGPVYQSAACEGRALARWDAVPEAIDPQVAQRVAALREALDSTHRRAPRSRNRSSRAARPALSACQRERQGRAKAYAAAGLKRDFAMSSYWDNRVHDACR